MQLSTTLLDIKFIRENKELVQEAAKKKRIKFDVGALLAVDDRRREKLQVVEDQRKAQNDYNQKIANEKNTTVRMQYIETMRLLKEELAKEEEKLKETLKDWQTLMLAVPNIPDVSVPDGDDDKSNKEVKKWGKLPWKKVLQPAYLLAKEGFPVYPSLARHIEEGKELLAKEPYTKELLFRNGLPLKVGELFTQADLAKTIDHISKKGKEGFSKGEIAKKIIAIVKERGGILTEKDLTSYQEKYRTPIRGKFKEFEYTSSPPPSAGGVLLGEMLNVLSGYDIAEIAKAPKEYYHLLTEVMKRSYADRSELIGDPDFFKSPYAELLTADYASHVREKINLEKATPSSEIKSGQFLKRESQHTTHLSIIDDEGNAVASTLTINNTFGAGFAAPGTGVFLNDEMDDFSAKPGVQNIYGLTSGESNAIKAGKRPVSSMTPTLFFKNGKPILAVGAAGGSRIISSVAQISLNYLVVTPGDLKRAMFSPRMHHQWVPDKLNLEEGLFEELESSLKEKGHDVIKAPWQAIADAVSREKNGETTAVFDPRDEGGAEAD